MAQGFDAYLRWLREGSAMWEFERSDDPPDAGPDELIGLYVEILDALRSVPNYRHPNARIHRSALVDDNVVVEDGAQILAHAVVSGPSFVGRGAVVGNFSMLRGNCFLSRDSLVGNHCYCNEVVIGRSARVAHFVNLSRSLVGYNSSISAFVLTATVKADKSPIARARHGQAGGGKFGCIIGANTFIAPHVLLLPGVAVGHRCFIGSFSVVNHDVQDEMFLGVEQSVVEKPSKLRIPQRAKLANFFDGPDPASERRYSGVLLVDGAGRFVLQRRDSKPGTYNPGKLSIFGGRTEGEETVAEGACRELFEETGLMVEAARLNFLTETGFVREDGSKTHCSIFFLENIDPAKICLQEGLGVEVLSVEEAAGDEGVTELCRIALAEYCKRCL